MARHQLAARKPDGEPGHPQIGAKLGVHEHVWILGMGSTVIAGRQTRPASRRTAENRRHGERQRALSAQDTTAFRRPRAGAGTCSSVSG